MRCGDRNGSTAGTRWAGLVQPSLDVMYRWRRSIVVVLLIALAAFVLADVITAVR